MGFIFEFTCIGVMLDLVRLASTLTQKIFSVPAASPLRCPLPLRVLRGLRVCRLAVTAPPSPTGVLCASASLW